MSTAIWAVFGYLLGSLPFSLWIGRLRGVDVRHYGDGNPGAANAWRAGSWKAGVPAVLLDFAKGALPVTLAVQCAAVSGWHRLPVMLAPVLGHAFSPLLRFRGGKAVATTFGVWTGLTLWEGPTILGCLVGLFWLLQTADAWTVVFSMVGLCAYWLLLGRDVALFVFCCANAALLFWTHRRDLRQRPSFGRRHRTGGS